MRSEWHFLFILLFIFNNSAFKFIWVFNLTVKYFIQTKRNSPNNQQNIYFFLLTNLRVSSLFLLKKNKHPWLSTIWIHFLQPFPFAYVLPSTKLMVWGCKLVYMGKGNQPRCIAGRVIKTHKFILHGLFIAILYNILHFFYIYI